MYNVYWRVGPKCTGNGFHLSTTCTGEWVLTVNVLEMGSTFPLHVLESGSLYNFIVNVCWKWVPLSSNYNNICMHIMWMDIVIIILL